MPEERGVRPRKVLLRVALVLGIASAVTMPAVAQASPKFFVNGAKIGTSKVGLVNYGEVELQNAFLGKIKCSNLASGFIWNESEKAFFNTEGYTTYNCTSEPACPGVFATAEMPVEVATRKKSNGETEAIAQRGPTTLPWSGEAIEVAEGVEKIKKIKTNGIKVTIVAPCDSAEVPFEGALEPIATNGSKNGLKASHVTFEGKGGRTNFLTSKVLPVEKEENIGYTIGEVKSVGSNVQLITLE
jgi:hypothetical protein